MTAPIDRIDQVYGTDVFSRRVMRQRLPKEIFKSLIRTIDAGEPLDAQVADVVAATMKDWAIENGATHFTHWFQPLTGLTAAKHDSPAAPAARSSAAATPPGAGPTLFRSPSASRPPSSPGPGRRSTPRSPSSARWRRSPSRRSGS